MLSGGSVFSGAGLLDLGLTLSGIHHRWLCEREEDRRAILAKRWPNARILDDVRHVGHGLERVDVIAGGFPCKGASTAGKRNGFDHPETVLWREMFRAIRELRPRYVLVENVANILSLHRGAVWGEVLSDLASLGMDVVWDCLPAASVGATHLRDRVFAVASYPDGSDRQRDAGLRGIENWRTDARGDNQVAAHAGRNGVRLESEPERGSFSQAVASGTGKALADADGGGRPGEGRRGSLEQQQRPARANDQGRGDSSFADAYERQLPAGRDGRRTNGVQTDSRSVAVEWGLYEPAIRRWEAVHGPAPEPLVRRVDDGHPAVQRVRARVDRSRLSALGDGVQVQVGLIAGAYIGDLERQRQGR